MKKKISNFSCLKTINRAGLRKRGKKTEKRKRCGRECWNIRSNFQSKCLKTCGLLNEEEVIMSKESKGKKKSRVGFEKIPPRASSTNPKN